MPPPTTLPKLPLSKLLLASALTLAIHSTLHAATDIESAPDGTSQNASASVTSSDPSNTITATAASGAPNSNGGNASASATLTPTSDSNSSLTATGGNGGNSTTSPPPGNGGNATLLPTSIINTTTANITLTAIALGGNGGNQSLPSTPAGNAGSATLNTITLSSLSGNISATATQTSGNGGAGASSPFNGIASDSSLTNIFSPSTTGNITLTQSAIGGNGSSGGNATSILTLTNTTAASLTAAVRANAGKSGTANATISVSGNIPLSAISSAHSNSSLNAATASSTITSSAGGFASATTSSLGNASATFNSSSPLYSNFRLYAFGNNVPGQQTVSAFSITQNAGVQAAVVLGSNFPGLIMHALLSGRNSNANGTQTHTLGYEGNLITTGISQNDLIFNAVDFSFPNTADFDLLRLQFLVNGSALIDQTFTTVAAADQFLQTPTGSARDYDLGPLSSFGPGPLDLQFQMDLTTHLTTQNMSIDLFASTRAATPEPTSLSLLTLATLPLLLKRRRKTSPQKNF